MVGTGKVKTIEGRIPADFIETQLAAAFLYKIGNIKFIRARNNFYAGLQYNSTVIFIDAPGFDNEDLLAIHGLFPEIAQTIHLTETKSISLDLVLPGIALIKRQYTDGGVYPFQGKDARAFNALFGNSKFSFARVFRFSIQYKKQLAPRTDLALGYQFNYTNYPGQQPIRIYDNRVMAGFKFYFKK
jgi:hypothetical protein